MAKRPQPAETGHQSAQDAAVEFAREEILGARQWRRSKLGYLTGAGTVRDAVGSVVGNGRDSVDRVSSLARAAFRKDKSGVAVDPEIVDSRDRFVEAMVLNGKTVKDIDRSVAMTFKQFWLYAALLALSTVGGVVSFFIWGFSVTSFPLINTLLVLARFSPIMILGPLLLRAGWTNWSFRRRRLESPAAYLRSGNLLPKVPPARAAGKPPAPANDRARSAAKVVSAIACLGLAWIATYLLLGTDAAFAQTTPATGTPQSIFVDNTNTDDLFMRLLSYVIPNTGPIGTPAEGITPMHEATKAGFMAFSGTLLFIGMTMAGWHILSGLVASAKEGTALGRNYHEVWAPARVVVGFGMLTPVAGGICGAQLLVLYLIVWGGNLANVVYKPYMEKLTLTSTDTAGNVARNTVNIGNQTVATEVVRQIARHEVCYTAVRQWIDRDTSRSDTTSGQNPTWTDGTIQDLSSSAAFGGEVGAMTLQATARSRVLDYGPACGRMEYIKEYINPQTTEQKLSNSVGAARSNQIETIQSTIRSAIMPLTQKYVNYVSTGTTALPFSIGGDSSDVANKLKTARDGYMTAIGAAAVQNYVSTNSDIGGVGGELKTVRDEALRNGWAAAGTFYLTTARLQNAIYTSATEGMKISDNNNGSQQSSSRSMYQMLFGVADPDGVKTGVLSAFDAWWEKNLSTIVPDISEQATRALDTTTDFGSAMTKIFGGLAKAWMVTSSSQQALNPMQAMIDYGNRLIMAGVAAAMAASGVASFADNVVLNAAAATAQVATAGLSTPVSMGLKAMSWVGSIAGFISLAIIAAGLIHAVVIPMVPYVMTVFFVASMLVLTVEALVAAPIWAFVHIRMDGQEFVDQVQKPGYMIAFNLVLRPALMIFGLILSYLVFGAMTWFVAVTFKAAAMSLAGSTGIGLLAAIVLIVLLSYLDFQLATQSFKLITQVPDRVTRWFGQGGENLGEEHDSSRVTGFIGSQITNRMESMTRGGAMRSLGQAAGGGGKPPGKADVEKDKGSDGGKADDEKQPQLSGKANNEQGGV